MKELEKTRRISISAVLFLLIILISLLTFRKPEFSFTNNTASTLEAISENKHLLSLNELESMTPSEYNLIDVRDNYDFSKGHMDHAINIPINQLLESIRSKQFIGSSIELPTILYGVNPEQANAAWMILYQLGYENLKILSVNTYYAEEEFHINPIIIGDPTYDYAKKNEGSKYSKVQKSACQTGRTKKEKSHSKTEKEKENA